MRGLRIAAVLLACVAPAQAGWAQSTRDCPPFTPARIDLPAVNTAIQNGEPVIIVAFGSSSTRGVAAANIGRAYPAILQTELTRRVAGAHIAVINRGIGGQDASEELVRIGRDVTALRPQLVIWQVGANAAIRNVDPDSFRTTVIVGIKRLQEAGADVILMDNQRAERILTAPRRLEIEHALTQAARATGAALFSRSALMDAWREQGRDYGQFLAADALHHNDLGYRCMAEALASTIIGALRRE